jgi:uncharacterized membrane-anchored protein
MIDSGFELPINSLDEIPSGSIGQNKSSRLFIVCVCMQFAVIIALWVREQYTLSTGTSIILAAGPSQPEGPFGSMRLCYETEYLKNVVDIETEHLENENIFVVVKRGEPFWTFSRVALKMPLLACDEVAIKARVTGGWKKSLSIDFGLQHIFLSREQSAEILSHRPTGEDIRKRRAKHPKLAVELKVDKYGDAAIRSLRLENSVFYPI